MSSLSMNVPTSMINNAVDIVTHAAAENDPQEALRILLNECIAATQSVAGRLFLLNLAESAYVEFYRSQSLPTRSEPISLLVRGTGETDDSLREVIRERSAKAFSYEHQDARSIACGYRARLIVPILRDGTCLGMIDLGSDKSDHFGPSHIDLVRTAAGLALLLCEKEDVLILLKALPRPIDFRQPFDSFLDDLMLLIVEASGMPLIALREWQPRDDTLTCLKSYGFDGQPQEELSIHPVSQYRSFQKAIQTRKTVVERSLDTDDARRLITNLRLNNVKSFVVVPVLIGTTVFGTLSFAVSCEHDYTTLEQRGLESIANAVGVAISNYRHFHLLEERLFDEARTSAAILAVDVAQATRHEARNHLQAAKELLVIMEDDVNALPAKYKEPIAKLLPELTEQLNNSLRSLDKIKMVTKPPEQERTSLKIEEVWHEAFSLVQGRLESYNISYRVQGTATAIVASDYMKHAFLQLILNSIDAFRDTKKRGRLIEVRIETPAARAGDIMMRYSDNATGIEFAKLKTFTAEGARPTSDIFAQGATSKINGSGYGLYLARKILDEHKGSIDLIDHRNGVVFQLKLPKED